MSVHLCLHMWGLIVYSLIQGRRLVFLHVLAMLLLFHTKAKETIVAIVTKCLSQNLFRWGASGFVSCL